MMCLVLLANGKHLTHSLLNCTLYRPLLLTVVSAFTLCTILVLSVVRQCLFVVKLNNLFRQCFLTVAMASSAVREESALDGRRFVTEFQTAQT